MEVSQQQVNNNQVLYDDPKAQQQPPSQFMQQNNVTSVISNRPRSIINPNAKQRFDFSLPFTPTLDTHNLNLQQTLHNRHQQQFLGEYINSGTPTRQQNRKAFNTIHPNGRPHSLAVDQSLFQQQQHQSDDDLYSVLSEKC